MYRDSQFRDLFALVPLSNQDVDTNTDSDAVAQVPFDFVVGEMLFPAGAYDVTQTDIPGTLALRRNGSEYPTALVQEIRSSPRSDGRSGRPFKNELLFYRQENLYFLAQVLASGD